MARALLITLYRNAPQGSYASERAKEARIGQRILYNKILESLKQTVGLYDVTMVKLCRENVLAATMAFHRVPVNVEVCFITS